MRHHTDKDPSSEHPRRVIDLFHRFAVAASHLVGSPGGFACGVLAIAVWALCGPLFGFSDAWQLVINTSTTIVTFLVVFLIQHSQNQDTIALHLKLDELIRATKGARNRLIDLETMSEEELQAVEEEFHKLRRTQIDQPAADAPEESGS